ncbi:hypothetical protein GALL_219950 [mine drainage metagenome]|uniref:Lipoprotein n=1 Tax=mine drainage metagenome TaxID=410659 RepID=A0A1J5RIT8_9ZZZZ
MKSLSFFLAIIFVIIIAGCSKTADNNAASNSATSLWPLKAGNSWVYQDSSYDATGALTDSYSDSTFITNQTTNSNGINFFGLNDSTGWFGTTSFAGVDGSNTSLYLMDSINTDAYVFFSLNPPDGYLTDSTDFESNPSNAGSDGLYGFKNTFTINGFTCYKNQENVTDENGNITYATVYYVSPGVGVVRIEEYSTDTNNVLYLDYSQTLKSYKLN